MKSDYVVVDTISVFKQRYIIPREEVERFNEEVVCTEKLAKLWAHESPLSVATMISSTCRASLHCGAGIVACNSRRGGPKWLQQARRMRMPIPAL